jgi:predicted nucleic acid-binding protein
VSDFTFDANIVIDALLGHELARDEFARAASGGARLWISRMAWVEVLSKGTPDEVREAEFFLTGLEIDEVDHDIALRASALRRERPRLKSPDAIILATALVRGRTLVTRNTRDFPAEMPGIRVPYSLPKATF